MFRTLLREGLAASSGTASADAVVVDASQSRPARLGMLASTPPLLLRLLAFDTMTGAWLDDVLPRVAGVVLCCCADAGDLVRLGTRLAVWEALAERPAGSIFTIAELAPAALLAPLGLAAARPRLAGLLWDVSSLEEACRVQPGSFTEGGPATVVRTQLALAGAALGLPVYDTSSTDADVEAAGIAARRLGFAGKVATHPGQLPMLARLFETG